MPTEINYRKRVHDSSLLIAMMKPWAEAIETKPMYWFGIHCAQELIDAGPFCYDCALKVQAAYRAENPSESLDASEIDGGWNQHEDKVHTCGDGHDYTDSNPGCRAILECSLTDYGTKDIISDQLEHGIFVDEPEFYGLYEALDPWSGGETEDMFPERATDIEALRMAFEQQLWDMPGAEC
jgi:hypothetical protein